MFKKGLLIGAALICFSAESAVADEEASKPLTLDTTVGVVSDYMFRGFNLYDGTAIQPAATLTYDTGAGKVAGNLWMHLSAEGDRQAEKFTEIDGTVSYQIELAPATLKVGHIWYTFPDNSDAIVDSAEFFANVVFDDSEFNPLFSVTPSFTVYEDYRAVDGQDDELSFSHLFEPEALGKGFNATPYVTFGFATNSDKVYDDDSGLMQVTYGVSSELALGDFSVVPSLNYTSKVDDATVNEFWFAGNLNYSF